MNCVSVHFFAIIQTAETKLGQVHILELKQETAEDDMTGLQSQFQNWNSKC